MLNNPYKFTENMRDITERQTHCVILNYNYAILFQEKDLAQALAVFTLSGADEIADVQEYICRNNRQ